ncbi:hypothetical protein [Microbacterium sp. EST19A]|uniref:hypothetical protein n=1 Tax=Microbacterium sp. EST19A TaxID=2862681 RepID=UPI001CBED83F|nr:hypothetical protein [Microbacterium sp. EST19A]
MSDDTLAKTNAALLRDTAADYRNKAAAGAEAADVKVFLTIAYLLERRANRITEGENDFSKPPEVDDEQG